MVVADETVTSKSGFPWILGLSQNLHLLDPRSNPLVTLVLQVASR